MQSSLVRVDMSQYWEATLCNGEVVTSDDVHRPRELPQMPVVVVIQPGSAERGGYPDLLINIDLVLFHLGLDCWREIDSDAVSLVTFMRTEGHELECLREGYWVPEFKEKYWIPAQKRLKELKGG